MNHYSSTVGIPVIMDHQGFISPGAHPSHMFVPPEDVQSKGLPSDGVPVSMSPPPPMQRDELKIVLMHQLEYYFSKDNLGSDKYLCKSTTECDIVLYMTLYNNINHLLFRHRFFLVCMGSEERGF